MPLMALGRQKPSGLLVIMTYMLEPSRREPSNGDMLVIMTTALVARAYFCESAHALARSGSVALSESTTAVIASKASFTCVA